jgi:hypothetical protein
VKSLLHFALTFVVVFRTNENVSIRPFVLAQFSQRFSDFIVHRNVSRSAVLGLSRRDDVAKEIDLTTLHSQLFTKTHPGTECDDHGWPQVGAWPAEFGHESRFFFGEQITVAKIIEREKINFAARIEFSCRPINARL